jgi:hypothetical protein
MGHGWWGIDYHWKARHELEMPFKIFWAGLCESHREFHDDGQRLKTLVEAVPFPVRIPRIIEDAYHKVHSRRSCDIENILVRLLISAIADGLWVRDHRINLQVFQPGLDASGFDLVLGSNDSIRYIQIKLEPFGKVVNLSLRQDISLKVGGCAMVLVYRPDPLEIVQFLFFGRELEESMPSLNDFPIVKPPGHRFADREEKAMEHYHDVPIVLFSELQSVGALADRLFPEPIMHGELIKRD